MCNHWQHHRFGILLMIITIWGTAAHLPIHAQTNNLNFTQTAEYDIGFDCPVNSVLDATGTILWVLMDNCFQNRYSLRAFDVSNGEQINTDDYADSLTELNEMYINPFSVPFALMPNGDLSIYYSHLDTYEISNMQIPIASGGEVTIVKNDSYNALLAGYSEYPDFSIYSPDHTKVVAIGATSFYVIDIQTETEIAEIPVEDTTDNTTVVFSHDSEHLYLIHYNSIDNPDDISSTLMIYDLATGSVLGDYQVPSSAIWVSPDETYVAANLFTFTGGELNELVIVDLATGHTSPAINLNEDPAPVTKCLNSGNDMSDVDFMTSGRFSFSDVNWSPDSSGLTIPLSYGGESAGGGSICYFNYSRLGTYSIERSG